MRKAGKARDEKPPCSPVLCRFVAIGDTQQIILGGNMSAEQLALFGGIVVSLAFSYLPGVKPKFDALSSDHKRLVNLGALFVVALAALGLSCIGRYNAFTCDIDGAWAALEVFVVAAIANQSAYLLTPKGDG